MNLRDTVLDHVSREKYGSAYTTYPHDHPVSRSIRDTVAEVIDPILSRFVVIDPEVPTIEVQVGMDFEITCGCGFKRNTTSPEDMQEIVEGHESETGHLWR